MTTTMGVPVLSTIEYEAGDCALVGSRYHRKQVLARNGHVCRPHFEEVDAALDEVEASMAVLPHLLTEPAATERGEERRTKAVTAGAPLRLDVLSLMDRRIPLVVLGDSAGKVDPVGELEHVAVSVCLERGMAGSMLSGAFSATVQMLHSHWPWAAEETSPVFAYDFAWRVLNARDHLRVVLGEKRPRPVALCLEVLGRGGCGSDIWPNGNGVLRCGGCGTEWSADEAVRLAVATFSGAESIPAPSLCRAWREYYGVSQSALADMIGISTQSLNYLETGRTRPRNATAEKWFSVLVGLRYTAAAV